MYNTAVFILLLIPLAYTLENGLARVPPMGWMAWERFRCITDCKTYPDDCISEKLFIEMADRMHFDGWGELGYKYVSIDDCWMSKERDANGKLQPDPERFPLGMKFLADHVHARHLKLGIYEDFGTLTCGGFPGSEGHLKQDADTFAQWGVDMLKFDGCYSNDTSKAHGYPDMGKYLNETGRPILYSCSWPAYDGGLPPKVNYTELIQICNSWRNYGDIQDSWASILDIIEWYAKNQDVLVQAAGPGHWNDPDMLVVGDFSLSYEQSKSQFGMWAMLAAPLFMSNDLRRISRDSEEILKNKWVIGINQDKLGRQGKRYYNKDGIQGWGRELADSKYAVAVLSTRSDDVPFNFQFTLGMMNVTTSDDVTMYNLFEVYELREWGIYGANDTISVNVRSDQIKMFHVVPLEWNAPRKLRHHDSRPKYHHGDEMNKQGDWNVL